MADSTKKTIYFHVGTHKTGTTALQKFLKNNEVLLRENGYIYPLNKFDEVNHCYLENFYDDLMLLLSQDIDYILSCENLYDQFANQDEVLIALKKKYNIKLIIYLKRQDLMMQSVYNEMIKGGSYYGNINESDNYQYDYSIFLEKVRKILGKTNIIVRVYERQQLIGEDIITDFLELLGIEHNNKVALDKIVNPSLSTTLIEYFKVLNKAKVHRDLKRQIHLAIADKNIAGEKAALYKSHALLSPQQCFDVLKNYQVCNEKIARDYLGRSDGKLFYEALLDLEQTWQAPPELNEELVLEITLAIHKQRKELLLKLYKQLLLIMGNKSFNAEEHNTDIIMVYHAVSQVLSQHDKQSLAYQLFFEKCPSMFDDFKQVQKIDGHNFLKTLSKKSKHVASLYKKDHYLMFKSVGDDPYVLLKPLTQEHVSLSQIFIVSIEIEPPRETVIQCFYKLEGEENFSPKHMLSQPLEKGLNKVDFFIKDPAFNGQLRIDVGNCAGIYKIKYILVKTGVLPDHLLHSISMDHKWLNRISTMQTLNRLE